MMRCKPGSAARLLGVAGLVFRSLDGNAGGGRNNEPYFFHPRL